ncbi:MAG: DUF1015 domain-containing protein [Clostridia bacterium]|nr:DUF1015 domain-containing protein [Clostridia bacterium]
MSVFKPFDVLLPEDKYLPKWPVIACDQFTSQPEYWEALEQEVGGAPSALRCILPEVELGSATEERFAAIRASMEQYLNGDVFTRYPDSFIYVERTLTNGNLRAGVVGVIDLDAYDYRPDATSAIRATEKTVVERIPPRMRVRRGAKIELSHVLLLCDDDSFSLIEPLKGAKGKTAYDLDLTGGGGHIRGTVIDGAEKEAFLARLDAYEAEKKEALAGMLYAVGDGNHSLATAKECYEELKQNGAPADVLNRARYAMVELQNIHDPVQVFEPIHRLVSGADESELLTYLMENCCADQGIEVPWFTGVASGVLTLDPAKGVLPVGILQNALDAYLADHPGATDYIHGDEDLKELAKKKGNVGFLLPGIPKGDFFRGIARDGVLPRKTFSMGVAREKRYYLEAREL